MWICRLHTYSTGSCNHLTQVSTFIADGSQKGKEGKIYGNPSPKLFAAVALSTTRVQKNLHQLAALDLVLIAV